MDDKIRFKTSDGEVMATDADQLAVEIAEALGWSPASEEDEDKIVRLFGEDE